MMGLFVTEGTERWDVKSGSHRKNSKYKSSARNLEGERLCGAVKPGIPLILSISS